MGYLGVGGKYVSMPTDHISRPKTRIVVRLFRCIVGAAVIAAICWRGYDYVGYRAHAHGVGGGIVGVKMEMHHIQFIFEVMYDNGNAPEFVKTLLSNSNIMSSVLFDQARHSSSEEVKYALSQYVRWNENGAFMDAWGSPYNFRITPVTNSYKDVVIDIDMWSSGPNRINENGKGDDIVAQRLSLE